MSNTVKKMDMKNIVIQFLLNIMRVSQTLLMCQKKTI